MLGDLRILDTGDELLLDTERVALQGLFNMIRRFSIGYDVELHKRTLERGLLSLIGPDAAVGRRRRRAARGRARARRRSRSGQRCRCARDPHRRRASTCCATPATSTRCAPRSRTPARAAVAEAAVECLRVEHGRPRYGIDLDDTVIPQEAGLNERAVSFTKGCYVGQETVARLYYRGKPNRQLRGLRLSAPAAPGDELSFEGRVGRASGERRRVAAVRPDRARAGAPRGAARVARSRSATARRRRRRGHRAAVLGERRALAPGVRHRAQLRRLGVRGEVGRRRSAARRSRRAARARRARRRGRRA